MLDALSNLSILTIIVIVIVIAPILTGLRIVIQRYFNLIIEKKVIFIYLGFYIILLSTVFILFSYNFFGGGPVATFLIMFLILTIIVVEYFLIYKKHFDFEPSEKYILCISISHLFGFMLLVLIFNLLTIIFTLLYE